MQLNQLFTMAMLLIQSSILALGGQPIRIELKMVLSYLHTSYLKHICMESANFLYSFR